MNLFPWVNPGDIAAELTSILFNTGPFSCHNLYLFMSLISHKALLTISSIATIFDKCKKITTMGTCTMLCIREWNRWQIGHNSCEREWVDNVNVETTESIRVVIRRVMLDKWQGEWTQSATGEQLRLFQPAVTSTIWNDIPLAGACTSLLLQLRTGHNQPNEILFWFGLRDSPLCLRSARNCRILSF